MAFNSFLSKVKSFFCYMHGIQLTLVVVCIDRYVISDTIPQGSVLLRHDLDAVELALLCLGHITALPQRDLVGLICDDCRRPSLSDGLRALLFIFE